MARERLTEARVRKLKAVSGKQVDTWDLEVPGFGVRTSARSKSYVVTVRPPAGGYATRITIGDADTLPLDEARRLAREMRAAVREGRDPIQERELRRQVNVRQSADTFRSLVGEFITEMEGGGLRPRSLAEYQRVLLGSDFKKWHDLPAASITPAMVHDLVATIRTRAPVLAARARAYAGSVFSWAVETRRLSVSPVELKRPTRKAKRQKGGRKRERTLTLEELRDLWSATASPSSFNRIVRLLILTGQRRNEVGGMADAEITADGATWTLPAERAKNGRTHVVPLSAPAREIIETARAVARLTAEPGRNTRPLFAARGKGGFNAWSSSKARLDAAIAKVREKDGRQPVPHWTLHDLRRTFVTLSNEHLRVRAEVVEAAVNHVSGHKAGIAGTYNHALYADEKREALDAWGRFVLGVAEGKPAGENVVQLRA